MLDVSFIPPIVEDPCSSLGGKQSLDKPTHGNELKGANRYSSLITAPHFSAHQASPQNECQNPDPVLAWGLVFVLFSISAFPFFFQFIFGDFFLINA